MKIPPFALVCYLRRVVWAHDSSADDPQPAEIIELRAVSKALYMDPQAAMANCQYLRIAAIG